ARTRAEDARPCKRRNRGPGGGPQIHKRGVAVAGRPRRVISDMARKARSPSKAEGRDGVVRRPVTIVNQRGLHARAAARVAKLAEQYAAGITVSANGISVSALSIMGLMLLAAGPGTEVEI